jgi:hypothetical protein
MTKISKAVIVALIMGAVFGISMVNAQTTTGTLTVTKVVNNNGVSAFTSSDFFLGVAGVNPSTSTFRGSSVGTVVTLSPGAFQVIEPDIAGVSTTFSGNCAGAIAAGQSLSCVVTNTINAGVTSTLPITLPVFPPLRTASVTVVKNVVNNFGTTLVPSDFWIGLAGTNVSTPTFRGSSAGTVVALAPGAFQVVEPASTGMTTTFSGNCSGIISAGQNLTCTVTNTVTAAGATPSSVPPVVSIPGTSGGNPWIPASLALTLIAGTALITLGVKGLKRS